MGAVSTLSMGRRWRLGDGDPWPAAVAVDRPSAAGCVEHADDPPVLMPRLRVSGPATCRNIGG